MKNDTQTTPLVCNMNVFTPAERESHIQMTTQLFRSVQNIREIERGYEFSFPDSGGSDLLTSLAEFISKERLCCPFLTFQLTIDTDSQPIALTLTGPEGTQEFLREEFSEAFA